MISPSKGQSGIQKSKRNEILERFEDVGSYVVSGLQKFEDYLKNNLRESDFGF